ncbi:hypothetical protein C2845_PM11G20260 [Panicum miliaceum]|uniref:NB-ARC domain-containing protein n=1 Tax=Panicum miliaceum TaxID=4540 RepID=A0A3L6RMR9_PANMI|nr:hypothetical protein C2845_PM11G20260 [Panicum miliaceum]
MAEAVVFAVVADVVGRAISLLAGQLQLRDRRGVDAKLRRLQHLVVKLESAVEAAGARRITSRALLEWLSELAGAAHRGRYFLDAFGGEMTDEDEGDGHGDGGLRPSLFSPSSFNPAKRLRVAARRMLFRGGGVGELDGVLANMEGVSGDLSEFIMLLQCCPPAVHRPLATNIYADSQMFGRHLERRRVIDFLLQDDDGGGGELGVLPIIGRAGQGKTTLVQHVCDEPAVRRRFSLILLLDFHCMSLTVASETVKLLRSLFTVASTSSAGLAGAGELLRLLERKLRGERFLAVFGNVDTRKKQVINAIMPALRRGRRGSRVVVTGSGKHVADLGTTEPVTLRPLPPAEYWFFFKAHAFGGADDAEADPRLAAVGQAIAKRLRGCFLGAKVVGALLRSRPDHRLWRRVLTASHAEPSWLGNGGVTAAARSLLPPHVTVRGVAVSGSPVRGLVGLQDASLTASPHGRGGGRPELPVLLCKTVFPSYFLYYTAYCTIEREDKQ